MISRKIDIIIKDNTEDEAGKAFSTVGIRFETENGFIGDYEKIDSQELTDEQIIGAVQRLMEKILPMMPKVEEPTKTVTVGESCSKFKRTNDGKFVLA